MASRTVEIRIQVNDLDAIKRLDDLAAKLDKLSKGTYTIRLRLDDAGATTKIDKLAAKLDKMGSSTYTPKISDSGITKANAEIDKLNLKLDELSHKRVTPTVHIRSTGGGGGSLLGDLLGGGGGGGRNNLEKDLANAGGSGGGGATGGILSALAGANNSTMGILIGGLVALGAAVTPALLPFGIGAGTGLGGTLLASKLGTTGITKLQADRQALAQARAAIASATAPGRASPSQLVALRQAQQALAQAKTPAQRAAAQAALARAQASISGSTAPGRASRSQILSLHQAQAQLARDQSKYGGFVPFGHAARNLQSTALDTFLGALTSQGPGFSAGPHGQPGGSFLQGLIPIFAQLGGFIKSLGPLLGELFRASLPFVKAFVVIMEQFAKAVMPAVLQSMKSLTPYLPQLVKGFVILAQGVADFIKDLGPGMKDSVTVFLGLMTLAKGLLIALAYAANYTAKFLANFGHVSVDVAKFVVKEWEHLWAGTVQIFNMVKSFIANVWNTISKNVGNFVIQIASDVLSWFGKLVHGTMSLFDTLRHDIATAWNTIWTNTKTAVSNGISAVVTFFKGLPGKILTALKGLGTSLYNFGKAALTDLWNGLKSVGGSIVSWAITWVKSLPSSLMHALGMSPPHPGSAFWDLGANIMHHFEAGIKSRAHHAAAAIHGAVGGPSGGSAGAAANYAKSLLARYGWAGQWGALNAVAMRESGWSMTARNPSSGAYGIAQFINGPSEYYQYGGNPNTIGGQVTGFFNYIRQRYGNPNAAWAHELNYGWYDRGGVLKKGLTLALNTTGQDEYITRTPHGGGGGNIYITVAGDTDPDGAALRIVQKIRKYKMRHGNAVLGIA